MKTPVLALLVTAMALSACSRVQNSRFNPFNWFGRSEPAPVQAVAVKPADVRPLVQQVLEMAVEPAPEGAIITAKGLPPSQGWWDGELVERSFEDGVLTYDFRLTPPLTGKAAGTPRSREVTVAAFVSRIKLASIRQIVVQGETNARSSRR